MKQIRADQLLQHRYMTNIRFSPGKTAAFILRRSARDQLSYLCELWLYENGVVSFLADMGDSCAYWWEDEENILLPAGCAGTEPWEAPASTVFYRLHIRTKTVEKAFEVPFKAGELVRYGETAWLMTGELDVRHPDLYRLSRKKRDRVTAEMREEALHYQVVDELPFYYNGKGMVNKKRTALFLVDPAGSSCCRLSAPCFHVSHFVAVGESVFYTGKEYTAKMPVKEGLYMWSPSQETPKPVTSENAFYFAGLCSANGKLVFLANRTDSYWAAADFYMLEPTDASIRLLAKNELRTRSTLFGDAMFAAEQRLTAVGDTVYYAATDRNAACIFCMGTDGQRHKVTEKEGAVTSFAVSEKTGEMLMSAQFDWKLQELYSKPQAAGPAETIVQVTAFNETVPDEVAVSIPEKMTLHTCGMDIDGWVIKPFGYDPKKSYPAVLEIHGGPLMAFGEVYVHEFQLLASQGYFVFYCNPAGSDGRGDGFADLRGRFGELDYAQLMDFTDAVLAAYPQIDRSRVCVTGGSYAGFLTNWIIGHTDRFACAVSQRSISNWISFYGVTDIGTIYAPEHLAAHPIDCADRCWDCSPLKYAAQVRTPTLFLHSVEDGCAPLSEAMQMYTALADRGIDTRLFIFKGENHELSRTGKPMHRIRRLQEMLDWFGKYTR